jgi:hypothetical protein
LQGGAASSAGRAHHGEKMHTCSAIYFSVPDLKIVSKSQSVQNSGPDNYVPVRRWYKHDEASEQVARNGSKHAGRGEVAGRQRRLGLVCSSSGGGGGGGVAISPLVGTIGHARWMPAKHSSVAMVVLMAPGLTIILIAAARCATYSRPAAARR